MREQESCGNCSCKWDLTRSHFEGRPFSALPRRQTSLQVDCKDQQPPVLTADLGRCQAGTCVQTRSWSAGPQGCAGRWGQDHRQLSQGLGRSLAPGIHCGGDSSRVHPSPETGREGAGEGSAGLCPRGAEGPPKAPRARGGAEAVRPTTHQAPGHLPILAKLATRIQSAMM